MSGCQVNQKKNLEKISNCNQQYCKHDGLIEQHDESQEKSEMKVS